MFEFRGAREAERSRAEFGSGNQVDAAFEQAMQEDGGGQATYQSVAANLGAAADALAAQRIEEEQRQKRLADQAAIQDALARQRQIEQAAANQLQEEQRQKRLADQAAMQAALAQQNIAAKGPALPKMIDLGFGASLGALAYPDLTAQQQATITDYLAAGRPTGLSGFMSGGMYDRILSGEGTPVFGPGGSLLGVRHEGFIPGTSVYSGRDLPYETAQEYGIAGFPPPEAGGGDGRPEVTSTVQDPMTGEEKCPEGYIFDEDLQACRKKPMERAAVDITPGERYVRTGLLDVAPEGLLEFQQRYGAGFGAPMDFAEANRAFRMGGAVTPGFYSTPPKLDGYTLLS